MYLTAPDIPSIRTSFSIKPTSAYTVSAMPTSEEVTALCKAITSNLKKLPRILPGTAKTVWARSSPRCCKNIHLAHLDQIFFLTRAIVWDSTVECQFHD